MTTDTIAGDTDELTTPHEDTEPGERTPEPRRRPLRALVRVPARWAGAAVRGPLRRPVLTLTVLAVLAVLLAAAVTAGTVLRQRQTAEEDARGAATDAARAGVTTMLSYHFQTFDDDVAKATGLLTGDFKQRYQDLMTGTVRATAIDQQTATNASVARASVISATPDAAETLLFVNQTTTSKNLQGPQLTGSRVQVSLIRDGDRWLITNLTPL
ncbi:MULTISPECIES: hypothetical protein [Amycolatopsis methanolica group]|uniref:Mce-associated membrane protein n=1 Tax=Amycolatopsis methanolica 239 TaxID=1068978 RepID=A0A076MUW9_AMYME|nr:hypothetical protein [Amycolatopsis methanolica]AIJ24663.1 hypothetical protein AMETH_4571 [Amycolatopsis methanolica 239]